MKHIKVFEDFNSISGTNKVIRQTLFFPEKLREFTEGYLAYLLDEGIKIQIELGSEPGTYGLFIQRFGNGFKWDDIKDHFIPFLHMLNKEYEIIGTIRFGLVQASGKWAPNKWRSVEEILNDEINERKRIVTISIDLKEKE